MGLLLKPPVVTDGFRLNFSRPKHFFFFGGQPGERIVPLMSQLNHFDHRNKFDHIMRQVRDKTRFIVYGCAVCIEVKKLSSPFCRHKHIQPRSPFSFTCCKVSSPFSEV